MFTFKLHEIFKESDGKVSFGRTASAIVLAAWLGWITFLVVWNHVLPELSGIIAPLSALYGANKISTAIGGFSKPNDGGQDGEAK